MQYNLPQGVTLYHADCREALRSLPSDSIDSVPCDPPYELNFMGKGWDDTGIANDPALWAEVYRVLKPGGHLAAFSASRTYHRMACAIEDAGFEIRDSLMWIYGTGFPKSLDVSKAIDKLDAVEARRERQLLFTTWMRKTGISSAQINETTQTNMASHYLTDKEQPAVATRDLFEKLRPHLGDVPLWVEQMVDERTVESENFKARTIVGTAIGKDAVNADLYAPGEGVYLRKEYDLTAAHTPEAAEWEGWGTALKPAFEPIVLARKPLSEPTVAANVLRWRTGALNIGACRIHTAGSEAKAYTVKRLKPGATLAAEGGNWRPEGADAALYEGTTKDGRWPANVVTDGSDEVVGMFPSSKDGVAGKRNAQNGDVMKTGLGATDATWGGYGGSGSAARFFYSAKASKADRNGSKHPTVKPIALMEWLAKLITPPGGTILDPFAGSGTTGIAATRCGFRAVLCEREAEYVRDIQARFAPSQRLPFPLDAVRRELALAPMVAALRQRLASVGAAA